MKTFIVHWLDGSIDEIDGDDIADALNKAGIGHGALRAMDYWEEKTDSAIVGLMDIPDEWGR